MVDLGTNTVAAQESVYLESKVESRTAGWHRLDLTLRRKDEYLAGKKVELDGIEKVHGIGLRIVKDLLDGAQPVVQLALILGDLHEVALFVFPMSGKSLLGHLVHFVGTNLHLYPTALP